MQVSHRSSKKINLENQWIRWSEKHPDKYGKPSIKLVAHISNRMYFIIIHHSKAVEFWLGTEDRRGETKLSGSFESDYTGDSVGEWKQQMIKFVREVYKNQDLNMILSGVLNSYIKLSNRTVEKINDFPTVSEEVKRVRLAYSVLLMTPKIFTVTVISVSNWNVIVKTSDGNVHTTLTFISLNSKGETYAQVKVIEPRMKVSDYISFGGLFQYKGLTPCTGTKNYLDKLLDNLYKVVTKCVVDEKYTLPYGDEEYRACLNRFDNCATDDTLKYKAELDSKFIAASVPLSSARDRRRALQSSNAIAKVGNYITSCDIVGVSEEVFDSKSTRRGQAYLYVKLTTELGITGYYRTIPVKGLHSKSILMNELQLVDLGITRSKQYISVEYNPVILEPSRTIIIRKRYSDDAAAGTRSSSDKLLEYISNNIKVLCTGHVYNFTLHNKLHYFDVIDSGNDKCSTLHVTFDKDVTIDILEAPLSKRKNALSLSPSAYDSEED